MRHGANMLSVWQPAYWHWPLGYQLSGSATFFLAGAGFAAGAVLLGFEAAPLPVAAPLAALAAVPPALEPALSASVAAGVSAGTGAAGVASTVAAAGRGGHGFSWRGLRLRRRSRAAAVASAITLRPPRSIRGEPGATEMPWVFMLASAPPAPPKLFSSAAAGAAALASSGAAAASGAMAAAAPPCWVVFWPAAEVALDVVFFLAGAFLGVSQELGESQPPWAAAVVASPPTSSRENKAVFIAVNLRKGLLSG